MVAFSAHFLKTEAKQALLSLFLKVLGGSSKEANGEKAGNKVIDSKEAYSKDIGSRKAVSKKVYGFSADFTLYIF